MKTRLLVVGASLALASPGLSQAPNDFSAANSINLAGAQGVFEAQQAWQDQNGAEWRFDHDFGTGFVRFVYGGHTASLGTNLTDNEFADLARVHVGAAYGLMGIDPNHLVLDNTLYMPLGMYGSSDKFTVRFRQVIDGVEVEGGSVNALFNMQGGLLSLDTVGLPDVLLPASVIPTRAAVRAEQFAVEQFIADTGLEALDVQIQGLVLTQEKVGKGRQGTLSWNVRVGNQTPGSEPQAFVYSVAATGTARVVQKRNQIHYFDVGGVVSVNSTPGISASTPSNPDVPFPGAYMRVTSPQAGTTFTDSFGNFLFPGVTGPITATFSFEGTYNDVNNVAGGEHSITTTLANGGGNNVLLNPTPDEFTTSQANAFTYINAMREWTRSVNPGDSTSDFLAPSNVNINNGCNAYYDGFSTNYFWAANGCVNTSFSSVIHHEVGHWMNDRYGSFNGGDGFGEGNADVFAMYQSDSPIVGDGFSGPGTNVRNGENTLQYCGDGNSGCYGQVHTDGQVLMGALWKVRVRLNNKMGDLVGDLYSDLLFNSWMNAYDDGQINSIIRTHWLTLDDDDGNVGNGSPNMDAIDAGFQDQGFPAFELAYVAIDNVAGPANTLDQTGPYGVKARIQLNVGTALTSANLLYTVNGGATQTVAMTAASNDRFFATIPGQASPNQVAWWIEASSDVGTNRYPKGSANEGFGIGLAQQFFFDNFETPTDNGWTHQEFATQDDWQREVLAGKAGDAPAAYSGTLCWANDAGNNNYNGEYQPNVDNRLESPTINLSGANGARLIYKRWLTVEEAIYDQASIQVNGTKVWTNPQSGNLIDTAWVTHEVDLSAYDGQSINLQWRLESDGGLEFGGWNIDDVSVETLSASPTTGLPSYYGTATPGSTTPLIDTAGEPASIGNADFRVVLKNAPMETLAYIGLGFTQINTPVSGITVLVNPTYLFAGQTDLFGQFSADFPIPNKVGLLGLTGYAQALVVDNAGPFGLTASRGMQITVVP
jgi:hypothetical protein